MRRILLDTDLGMGRPGSDIDDGFALALAMADPGLQVDLVTTVNGNTDVDTATRLTVELLERIGRSDVPVARGATKPLRDNRSHAASGSPPYWPPGVDGRTVPHAAAQLVQRVMAAPGDLTIVAIGPLTNVALALALEPRIAESVVEIVVMGGVFLEHTNVADMPGEFNFWVDPVAADAVLTSGAPLRLVGLDVTQQVRLTRTDAARLAASEGRFGGFAAACTDEWISHLAQTLPGNAREHESCALHDPLAVAVVAEPDLVEWRSAQVRVETDSPRTRGVAVADLLTTENPPLANCRIAVGVDADRFRERFLGRIALLP